MSTLVGAIMGRFYRIPVLHVEAGMRSGNWREPFPEELTRRLVSRLAKVHFAPSDEQVRNLSHYSNVVSTFGNTAVDALAIKTAELENKRTEPYVLVSLHRQELISDREKFLSTITALCEISEEKNVVMILDHQTEFRLNEMNALDFLTESKIRLLPKQTYGLFVGLLIHAEAVITDSGGLQQECAELGIPCLVHRRVSETLDGLGENVSLSGGDVARLAEFVAESNQHRRKAFDRNISPSQVISKYVTEHLFKADNHG